MTTQNSQIDHFCQSLTIIACSAAIVAAMFFIALRFGPHAQARLSFELPGSMSQSLEG